MRTVTRLAALGTIIILGALAGLSTAGTLGAQTPPACEKNACDLDRGNCVMTDIRYACDMLAGSPPCKSIECAET